MPSETTEAVTPRRAEIISRQATLVRLALEAGHFERAASSLRGAMDELLDVELTSRRDLSTALAEVCGDDHYRTVNALDRRAGTVTARQLVLSDADQLLTMPDFGERMLARLYAVVLKWLVGVDT
jgi:hypothetical protein